MNWLNLPTATLHAPEYIGAEPVARATWFNVLLWSCSQENGGRIAAAKAWKDRQWQQVCGVTLREVNRSAPLLEWEGDDLVIWRYPLDKQREVAERRETARLNGRSGGRRPGGAAPTAAGVGGPMPEPTLVLVEEPTLVPTSASGIEGEGEGEGEREGKLAAPAREARRSLPENLDTSEFRSAWEAWVVHWAEAFHRRTPMPHATADAHLRVLAPLGAARAISAIENATARGLRTPAEPFANSASNHANPGLRTTRSFEQQQDYAGITDR